MTVHRAVLLDLDGTLVDPAGSITGGISAALSRQGLPQPTPAALRNLVGPPLREGLLGLEGVTEANVAAVIADYRSHYWDTGMAASRPYPGVEDALADLAQDQVLAVATSKPITAARRLLELNGLTDWFVAICGAADDANAPAPPHGTKVAAIGEALDAVGNHVSLQPGDELAAVMVGDRHFDITGATHHGLPSVGVQWGFSAPGELKSATATCHDPAELPSTCRTLQNGVS